MAQKIPTELRQLFTVDEAKKTKKDQAQYAADLERMTQLGAAAAQAGVTRIGDDTAAGSLATVYYGKDLEAMQAAWRAGLRRSSKPAPPSAPPAVPAPPDASRLKAAADEVLTVKVRGKTVAQHIEGFLDTIILEGQQVNEVVEEGVKVAAGYANASGLPSNEILRVVTGVVRNKWGNDAMASLLARLIALRDFVN